MNYACPVCDYGELEENPTDKLFNICPSCGTEFGNDDADNTYGELKERWIAGGRKWWSRNRLAAADLKKKK